MVRVPGASIPADGTITDAMLDPSSSAAALTHKAVLISGGVAVSGHDTIQAAVTAAGDLYAADNEPKMVIYDSSALEQTWTDEEGVTVVPLGLSTPAKSSGLGRYGGDMAPTSWPVPYSCPKVAVRVDDGWKSWHTVDATGLFAITTTAADGSSATTNVCPLDYARYLGIPVSMCAIYSYLTVPETYATAAMLRRAFWNHGTEIYVHGYDQGALRSGTLAHAYQEIVRSRDLWEALQDTSVTPNDVGLIIRGFTARVNEGTTFAMTEDFVGRMIRSVYEWSTADYASGPMQKHFSKYNVVPGGEVASYPNGPDHDVMFMCHGITNLDYDELIGQTGAEVKTMLDTIAAWRDAGLCQPVTMSTWFLGQAVTPATRVVTGESVTVADDVGSLNHRYVENILAIHGTVGVTSTNFSVVADARTLATGEVHVNYRTGAITFYSTDEPGDTVTVDYVYREELPEIQRNGDCEQLTGALTDEAQGITLGGGATLQASGGNPGKFLRFDGTAWGGCTTYPRGLVPGRSYLMSWDAKSPDATPPRLDVAISLVNGTTLVATSRWIRRADSDTGYVYPRIGETWTKCYMTFGVPKWAGRGFVATGIAKAVFQLQTAHAVDIDNIQIIPI